MLEKRLPGDSSVIDSHDARARVGGEPLRVTIPRRPCRLVGVQKHQRVAGLDRRRVRADRQRIEPVHPDEMSIQGQRSEIRCLHPADREVKVSVGDAGRLRVRRHDPGVDAQLCHACGPFGPVGGAPVHIADPHRFGREEAGGTSAQLVGLNHQRARMRQQSRTASRQRDGAPVAVEQADLQVTFERLDLLGERRARDMQPLGRAPEVQLLGDRHEVAQLPQLHRASVVQ